MPGDLSIEAIGWAAVALNVGAYSAKTMLPLRLLAIASNVAFFIFAYGMGISQTMALNTILFVLNVWRLAEMIVLTRRLRTARVADFDLSLLMPLLRRRHMPAGALVFRKGDAPDHFYILGRGRIALEEAEIELGAGEVFGEIGFFSDARERTLSARCIEDCELFFVDEQSLMRIYYRNPDFALYIVRLISRRLLEGTSAKPEAYRSGRIPQPAIPLPPAEPIASA